VIEHFAIVYSPFTLRLVVLYGNKRLRLGGARGNPTVLLTSVFSKRLAERWLRVWWEHFSANRTCFNVAFFIFGNEMGADGGFAHLEILALTAPPEKGYLENPDET
jgi:hypothetical protein